MLKAREFQLQGRLWSGATYAPQMVAQPHSSKIIEQAAYDQSTPNTPEGGMALPMKVRGYGRYMGCWRSTLASCVVSSCSES